MKVMKQKGLFCLPRNQRGMVFTSLENHHALISPTATEVVNNVVFKIATLKREKAMKMDEILKLRKETDSLLCKAVLESEMSAGRWDRVRKYWSAKRDQTCWPARRDQTCWSAKHDQLCWSARHFLPRFPIKLILLLHSICTTKSLKWFMLS
ncbi:hypothetical protein HKD37_13G035411 [Glycine soja]